MIPDTILSLALLSRDAMKCPRCNCDLVRKTAFLRLGVPKQVNYAQASVLFCSRCHDYYGNDVLMDEAREFISAVKHWDKKKIRIPNHNYSEKQAASVLSKPIQKNRDKRKERTVSRTEKYVDIGGEKTLLKLRNQLPQKISPKKVILTLGRFTVCPSCKRKLLPGYIANVPISSSECVQCELDVCHACNVYYSPKISFMQDLAVKCVDSDAFSVDSTYLQDIERCRQNMNSRRLTTAYCRFILCSMDNVEIYTIITNMSEESIEEHILHYGRPAARDLLTAAVLHQSVVILDDAEYVIQSCDFLEHEDLKMRIVRPDDEIEVEKRKNGGFYEANPSYSLVDGLVFCEKTRRLELLRMTYDESLDLYYVDPLIYRSFKQQYGLPIVSIHSPDDGNREFRTESVLHQLGYNVNEKSCLTAAERHEMLARFVDLGFVTVSSIVNLLTMLIKRNGVQKAESKIKWQEDLAFISNYKVCHDRFAFVERIRNAARTEQR